MLLATLILCLQSLNTINGCGLDGSAPPGSTKALDNRLKNRYTIPDSYTSIEFNKLLTGKRKDYSSDNAATVIGYVLRVKSGGPESCNCESDDEKYKDTHLVLVNSLKDPLSKSIIVEVTPRMRVQNPSWTYTLLRKNYLHKKVIVSGWLYFDKEHIGATWRGTCWELHPVTKIELFK